MCRYLVSCARLLFSSCATASMACIADKRKKIEEIVGLIINA